MNDTEIYKNILEIIKKHQEDPKGLTKTERHEFTPRDGARQDQ